MSSSNNGLRDKDISKDTDINKDISKSVINNSRRNFLKQSLLFGSLSLLVSSIFIGGINEAKAKVEVDIRGANFQPLQIALPLIEGNNNNIHEVIKADLARTGYFRISDAALNLNNKNAYVQNAKANNIAAVIIVTNSQNNASVEIINTSDAQNDVVNKVIERKSNFDNRLFAHAIADSIYKETTGDDGYFTSQIAFVAETGSKDNRKKRIALMDYDGANVEYLTGDESLVITPRLSPDGKKLAYMDFTHGKPKVIVLNINNKGGRASGSKSRTELQNVLGLSFAPTFSPDSNRIILSEQLTNNSQLLEVNLINGQTRKLTQGFAINTSPSFSPDGQKIVFESDRSGSQQLYIMDLKTLEITRLTYGDGRYASPSWSPKGDLIAFTKISKGEFGIGVIRPDGKGEKILTSGFHNEGPSFSPNGRVLTYFKDQSGGAKLYTIDVSGRFEQQIPTSTFASDPNWGASRIK